MNATKNPPPVDQGLAFQTHALQMILLGHFHVRIRHCYGPPQIVSLQLYNFFLNQGVPRNIVGGMWRRHFVFHYFIFIYIYFFNKKIVLLFILGVMNDDYFIITKFSWTWGCGWVEDNSLNSSLQE